MLCVTVNTDDCGVTPLLAAALNDHLQTCVTLIASNCLLDVVGDVKLSAGVQRELTALQGAVERHHFAVARLLLAAGASCDNVYNPSTQPPQHLLSDDDGFLYVPSVSGAVQWGGGSQGRACKHSAPSPPWPPMKFMIKHNLPLVRGGSLWQYRSVPLAAAIMATPLPPPPV